MIYLEQNDEILVTLTLAGNQQAYEALVTRYQKVVLSAAYAVTHNWYMAEDAAQDAFVSAWIKLNVLREPSKFPAWVCRIAKNCAKNLVMRYRDYVSVDVLKNREWESADNVEACVAASDEGELLRESVGSLPEKVRQVMTLHYFEGLSLAEIADRLRLPLGTVKWQLHDGRQRLRKEFGVVNENERDTFVQRVMKQVEELKRWRLHSSKDGFETAYADVLADVEKLPESVDKYHAMADVLLCGYWWLPGEKNDALLARIRDAAEAGNNEEVFGLILSKEEAKLSGQDKITFMRDKQIPILQKKGYTKALGREWFWLGREYFLLGDAPSGYAAYEQVLNLLTPSDVYYANALAAIRMEKAVEGQPANNVAYTACGEEIRLIDGKLRFWSQPGYSGGDYAVGYVFTAGHVNHYASLCDSLFYDPKMQPGDVYTGSDGITTLTFAADGVSVETACGVFEDCELWVTKLDTIPIQTVKTYYKDGVGIVRSELNASGLPNVGVCTLKSYTIRGGSGLMPFAAGNRWEYTVDVSTAHTYENVFEVTSFDGTTAILWSTDWLIRHYWDENDWNDQIRQMRNDYCKRDSDGDVCLCDVSLFMERAKALAKTPLQKLHTKTACEVMRRIWDTDPQASPNATQKGHWNFFEYRNMNRENGDVRTYRDFLYSFEWKCVEGLGEAGYPLLFNDIYGILEDATQALWSDKWQPGYRDTLRFSFYKFDIVTELACESAGTIVTAAGTFEQCLRISLNIQGLTGGFSYRGSNKEYIFAPGVGIVRVTHWRGEHKGDYPPNTYELTAYTGVGEGYMPFADGFFRRYEAVGLTDGFVGAAEYTYATDETGQLVILGNRTGIRQLPKSEQTP